MVAEKDKPNKTREERKADREKRENALAAYGWSQALINSDKELKRLFDDAVDGGWSAGRFTARLRDTKWFKKHSESWRTNETLRLVDHATWENRKAKVQASLRDEAQKIGAVIDEKQMSRMADNVMSFGWEDAQIKNALANYVKVANTGADKGQFFGEAARNAESLRLTAMRNGYDVDQKELGQWNKAIALGNRTVEDYEAHMRKQAALAFPSFAEELKAGMDMMDVANPYITEMANTLEIPKERIDLKDQTLRKALASKNEKTGKPEAMALYDFADKLRQDERWLYTDNAHQKVMGSAQNLLRSFGLTT